jgi:hypothetical protein
MTYIVLETFWGADFATICSDEEGDNLVFDTLEEAEAEAADTQGGIVVEIKSNQ